MVSSAITEEKIIINGLEANVKKKGDGNPLLILHGWGGSSDSWVEMINLLAEKGYRIICPDFPGFGKSRPPFNPWTIDDYVNWTISLINLLGLRDFVLVGHSFGGRISIRLGADYPEIMREIILCDSAGIKPGKGPKTYLIYIIAKIGNALFTSRILRRFKDGVRNLFYSLIRSRDYIKANGVMKETIKNVLERDLLPDLDRIRNRTLIVWGEKDMMVPLKYARVFNERIKGSRLVTLPKIGHSPHLEVPERLVEIIIQFLQS
jgi:pimeloyl-ACP methyl ester carboxylesterase